MYMCILIEKYHTLAQKSSLLPGVVQWMPNAYNNFSRYIILIVEKVKIQEILWSYEHAVYVLHIYIRVNNFSFYISLWFTIRIIKTNIIYKDIIDSNSNLRDVLLVNITYMYFYKNIFL